MSSYSAGFAEGTTGRRLHLNEHPEPPPAMVLEAAGRELRHLNRYPDPDARALIEALAEWQDVPTEMLAVANGIDEMLLLIALAFAQNGARAVTCEQTYPGYAESATLVGADVARVSLDQLHVSLSAMKPHVKRGGVVYVCNPHNPTGTAVDAGALSRFAEDCADAGAIAVIDEAYAEFALPQPQLGTAVRRGLRAIVLRTFSKALRLGGIRLGWAMGPPDLIAEVRRAKRTIPFSVNRVAQAAGIATIRSYDELAESACASTRTAKRQLYRRLDEMEVAYVRSQTHFVLIHTGVADAAPVAASIAANGVMVRDLGPLFGLPGSIRATCFTVEDAEAIVASLQTAVRGRRLLSHRHVTDKESLDVR